MSDTCLGFLYTLWLNHPEMDFFFFVNEVVEEVKQYAVKAAENVGASILSDPSEVTLPATHTEVQHARVAEAQPMETSEVKPTEAVVPSS